MLKNIGYILAVIGIGNLVVGVYFVLRYYVEQRRMRRGTTIEEVWFGVRPRKRSEP